MWYRTKDTDSYRSSDFSQCGLGPDESGDASNRSAMLAACDKNDRHFRDLKFWQELRGLGSIYDGND